MPREHSYALRRTSLDQPNDYVVIDENGIKIARNMWNVGVTPPRWQYSVGIGALPQIPTFRGHSGSVDGAKARVKELWPLYRAQWSDEQYEKGLRQVKEASERTAGTQKSRRHPEG